MWLADQVSRSAFPESAAYPVPVGFVDECHPVHRVGTVVHLPPGRRLVRQDQGRLRRIGVDEQQRHLQHLTEVAVAIRPLDGVETLASRVLTVDG
jgi:hypothetical protein